MPAKSIAHVPSTHVPSMSDSAVQAKTTKTWADWFTTLDAERAVKLAHKDIVRLLVDKYAVPAWWRQMIAVEYERARGLRVRHETAKGFSVSVSKTMAADVSALYAATADEAIRKRWFPKAEFISTSFTREKYCRGSWKGAARLSIGFFAKGANKSQIAIEVGNLAKNADVEVERAAWKKALDKLKTLLGAPASRGASEDS